MGKSVKSHGTESRLSWRTHCDPQGCTKKNDPYEPFKYTSKFTKLTPKSLNTDLTKQEQKLVIEKVKKVEDKVKWSKSNKEDTIKKEEELKGGESMTGSKKQCKSYSFKGKTKKACGQWTWE